VVVAGKAQATFDPVVKHFINNFENLVLGVHVTHIKSVFNGKYLRKAISGRSNNVDLKLRSLTVRSDNGSSMLEGMTFIHF
jgi:hypothetical protein